MPYCAVAFLHVWCQGMFHILYESDSFLVKHIGVLKHLLSINTMVGVILWDCTGGSSLLWSVYLLLVGLGYWKVWGTPSSSSVSIPESTPAVMTATLTLVLWLLLVGFGEIPQYAHEPQRDPAGDPKRTSEGNKVNMKLALWIDHDTTLFVQKQGPLPFPFFLWWSHAIHSHVLFLPSNNLILFLFFICFCFIDTVVIQKVRKKLRAPPTPLDLTNSPQWHIVWLCSLHVINNNMS